MSLSCHLPEGTNMLCVDPPCGRMHMWLLISLMIQMLMKIALLHLYQQPAETPPLPTHLRYARAQCKCDNTQGWGGVGREHTEALSLV